MQLNAVQDGHAAVHAIHQQEDDAAPAQDDGAVRTLRPYRLLDAGHDVANIIIAHIRSRREAETDLKDRLGDTVQIGRRAGIDGLLVHGFPDRTALDLLAEHEDAQSLHVLVGLAVGLRRARSPSAACHYLWHHDSRVLPSPSVTPVRVRESLPASAPLPGGYDLNGL